MSASNPLLRHDRLVRWLHPLAWWAWAVGAAAAASSTTNPLVLTGIALGALLVVTQRGVHAPWAASVTTMLQVAAVIVVLRLLLQVLLGAPVGTHVIARLPAVPLPAWMAGVRLGGVVTLESVLLGLTEGLRFAAILVCVAAATTVAAPSRLFRALPARVADVGTLLIVAMTMVPHLVADFRRIAAARRLRGRRTRGVRAAAASLLPVLDGALERSMLLATSMFSRGYGRGQARTRHRPDPWRAAETTVVACGLGAPLLLLAVTLSGTDLGLAPLRWPQLPPLAALACALVALPAILTPRTPPTDAPEVV